MKVLEAVPFSVLAVLTSCVGSSNHAEAGRAAYGSIPTTVTCDRFDPKATLRGDQLSVSLDTDLPDSTVVMVGVARSYFQASSASEYPLNYFVARATVGEWRKPNNLTVNHTVWQKLLDDRARSLAAAGLSFAVQNVDQNLTISFTVPISQPDPRFGQDNRGLVGRMVSTKGLRSVRAEVKVSYPLGGAGVKNATEFGTARGLQPGLNYRLARRTLLMPERDPTDPLRAANMAQPLPPGTVIHILKVDQTNNANPWYHVSATGNSGANVASGWINSIALIGQELKVLRP